MFTKARIKNFKCFADVTIEGLKPVNLVVGGNASGKTALLEALFHLCGAGPELIFTTKAMRGDAGFAVRYDAEMYAGLWRDLFHKFNQEESIEIAFGTARKWNRKLKVYSEKPKSVTLQSFPHQGAVSLSRMAAPKSFTWETDGKSYSTTPTLSEKGLQIPFTGANTIHAVSLAARLNVTKENAERFSKLSKNNLQDPLIEAVQRIYPFIEDLSVEVDGPNNPLVYAKIQHLPGKLPITYISAGINHFLSILLAIGEAEGGIAFIDEIENGLYYELLPAIWNEVAALAEKNKCQLFITTHSYECIQAVAKVAEKNKGKFALLRTMREDGKTIVQNFGDDIFIGAINDAREVR